MGSRAEKMTAPCFLSDVMHAERRRLYHQLAGSTVVIEMHGNIMRTKCSREDIVIDQWAAPDENPPRCPRCGAYLRPDVVWFGEMLPPAALEAAAQAANTCDVFFSIGTSGLVEPAASIARVALKHGAAVMEINPTLTPLTARATLCCRARRVKSCPVDQGGVVTRSRPLLEDCAAVPRGLIPPCDDTLALA